MNIFSKFFNYCQVCYDELAHKVTWPTLKELTGSAVLVLTASVIIALVVWGMDFTFEKIMGLVYPG
jgi:preprotein translocase subunit SecE